MTKRLLVVPAFVILVGTTLLATDSVSAFGFGQGQSDTMIERFAEKFGKSEDEVRVIFDEMHQEHMDEMEAGFAARLDEAATNGAITPEQKQLILTKHEETHQIHQDMWQEVKDMSPEDRRATMQAQHDEMEEWAAANGIDLDQLGMYRPMGQRGMHRDEGYSLHQGQGMGRGMNGGSGMHLYQQ